LVEIMFRQMATDSQVILALITAIASHPMIVNAKVYHLVNKNIDGTPQQVKISKLRAYAGLELIDLDGVVMSVYPSPRSGGTGINHTMTWAPYHLGNTQPGLYLDKGLFNVSIELRYFDPDFQAKQPVYIDISSNYADTTWHGSQLSYIEKENKSLIFNKDINEYVDKKQIVSPGEQHLFNTSLDKSSFGISVLPAEEVLKEYTTIVRHVIRDIKVIKPFNIRNLGIKHIDYDTGEIFDQATSENLVFHKSRIGIELEMYETNASRPELPLVDSYLISTQDS
jgi:hypothetical protein